MGQFGHDQIFAADSARRGRIVRAALAGAALLLAGWLAALALGAFGGFGAFPELQLGGSPAQEGTAQPEPAGAVAGVAAKGSAAGEGTSAGSPDQAVAEDDGPPDGSTHTPRPEVITVPLVPSTPAPPPAASTNGNANGQGDTKTTGKPITTPGTGSSGSNAGGNGSTNGQGKGLSK